MITSDNSRHSVSGLLLKEIYKGSTIQNLLDTVFDTWYYPSLFISVSRHVEYYSKYSSEYDPWSAFFHNGALDQDTIDGPISELLTKRRSANKMDHVKSLSLNGQTYVLTLVTYINAPLGFILTHCTRSRSYTEAAEICCSLSEAIAFLIERDPAVNMPDHDYMRDYIARELLQFDERNENASPVASTTENIANLLWPNIRPAYRIAAITIEETDIESLKELEVEFFRLIPENYSLLKGNTLYLFFYDLETGRGFSDKKLKERIERIAENNSVVIALSSCFQDIDQRQVYRRQAVDLSRMSCSVTKNKGVLEADDHYSDQMVYASIKRVGSEVLTLSELKYLKDYDEKNGTEYLDTLCAYLRNSGIIRSAASELHIEPKSLRYRIKKICDILNRSREELLSDKALLLSSIASCPAPVEHSR